MPYLMNYQAEEHNVLHEMSNLEDISDDVYLLANEHYRGTSNYTPPSNCGHLQRNGTKEGNLLTQAK